MWVSRAEGRAISRGIIPSSLALTPDELDKPFSILDQAVIAVFAVCFSPYTGNVTAIPARGLGGNRNNRINRSLRCAVRSERAFEIAPSAECQLAQQLAAEIKAANCAEFGGRRSGGTKKNRRIPPLFMLGLK